MGPYFLRKSLKTQEKLEELEIMYLKGIYICVSWYSKICSFPVKKSLCQQNSRFIFYTIYIFFGSSLGKVWLCQVPSLQDTCDRFYGVGGPFWAAPKNLILNRVKMFLMILIVLHLNINKRITGQTGINWTKDLQIMVPLKYSSNFWTTFEIQLS